MQSAPPSPSILLVDDGELDEVVAVLDAQGIAFERLRGGQIPDEIAPPRDLLIVTPRRVEKVRRGSPPEAAPGRPLRIIAVQEDSPSMRRRLRRSGLHMLVRLPAEAEIWRLLVARALYQGSERRNDPRVAVGSQIEVEPASSPKTDAASTVLIDLSNRGCRIQTTEALEIGDTISITIPAAGEDWGGDGKPLALQGRVRRQLRASESEATTLAVVFDADLDEVTRTRLAAVINRWASGPSSRGPERTIGPAIPTCRLASLPDLTLDDETDPPIPCRTHTQVQLETMSRSRSGTTDERRDRTRGRFESPVLAETHDGPIVLIGRDVSATGMRVEKVGGLAVGDRFRLALHGPGPGEPFVVDAEIARDDGDHGLALRFRDVEPTTARELEKLVACLPDVESLETGELGALGAILSEIVAE